MRVRKGTRTRARAAPAAHLAVNHDPGVVGRVVLGNLRAREALATRGGGDIVLGRHRTQSATTPGSACWSSLLRWLLAVTFSDSVFATSAMRRRGARRQGPRGCRKAWAAALLKGSCSSRGFTRLHTLVDGNQYLACDSFSRGALTRRAGAHSTPWLATLPACLTASLPRPAARPSGPPFAPCKRACGRQPRGAELGESCDIHSSTLLSAACSPELRVWPPVRPPAFP